MTPAPYEVAWTGTARRALTRLPEKVATAVIELCYGPWAENPQPVGKSLKFDLTGVHSARRGDFRVIHRIDEPDQRIDVLAIEHRPNTYRRSVKSQPPNEPRGRGVQRAGATGLAANPLSTSTRSCPGRFGWET